MKKYEKAIDSQGTLVYYIDNTPTYFFFNGGEKLEFNEKLPIYIQIMDYLKRKIATREINGGEKLPSVRELSKELQVNPNTVQRSYQELERENLVFTQRGMGTFVVDDEDIVTNLRKSMAAEVINIFMLEMKGLGFNSREIVEIVSEKMIEEGD